ncbi:MAG: hypothetical protein EOO48_11315 [Flavobacterium sp.]|nr:MAG: hypothetical protein EOO48_11315 [Flavobacterium sp.]
MKKHSAIFQFVFGAAVLFAILFQSVDSLGHLEREFSEKQCHHKYAAGRNEVNHSHHNLEKCYVCEFTFSNFIQSKTFSFQYKTSVPHARYCFFHSKEITQFFRGSLFSHRGPPAFIA